MLTRLYRYGPAKQTVIKGYVVNGENALAIIRETVKSAPFQIGNTVFNLRTFPRYPKAIYIDSGAKWLYNRAARDEFWREFAYAATHIAEKIKTLGGVLLPNAIRPSSDKLWRDYLCDDIHILQTSDDLETAVFCNLLRNNLPSLIALTGNAGATGNQAHGIGSRRLLEGIQQYTPHHLISATPAYLKRVQECLRNDFGVQDLNFLDIYPFLNESGKAVSVVLRFNDGQTMLSTVRAQAILYQALFISARKRAREAYIPSPVDYKILIRNRARAIAKGIQAKFEPEPLRENHQHYNRRLPKKQFPYRRAFEVLLQIFEDLQNELQTLEVEYDEIAPIILGLTLRKMERPALVIESDWLKMAGQEMRKNNGNLNGFLAQMIDSRNNTQDLKFWNEKWFAESAQEVREWWERFLSNDV